jgi:hypothetical protein
MILASTTLHIHNVVLEPLYIHNVVLEPPYKYVGSKISSAMLD